MSARASPRSIQPAPPDWRQTHYGTSRLVGLRGGTPRKPAGPRAGQSTRNPWQKKRDSLKGPEFARIDEAADVGLLLEPVVRGLDRRPALVADVRLVDADAVSALYCW